MSHLTHDTCSQLKSIDDLSLVQLAPNIFHVAHNVHQSNPMPKTWGCWGLERGSLRDETQITGQGSGDTEGCRWREATSYFSSVDKWKSCLWEQSYSSSCQYVPKNHATWSSYMTLETWSYCRYICWNQRHFPDNRRRDHSARCDYIEDGGVSIWS